MDPEPHFDLVIVDEAHNIRNANTWMYRGVEIFCRNADAVVFLTATPLQKGKQLVYKNIVMRAVKQMNQIILKIKL